MDEVYKTCKLCKVDQPKNNFSGRSARCCKCMYAKNKEFFSKYYIENGEKMRSYEREKYKREQDARQLLKPLVV